MTKRKKKQTRPYSVRKTEELIEVTKSAIDILMKTLEGDFEVEYYEEDDENGGTIKRRRVDNTKLKSFIESKKIAFFSAKELIKEVEQLEKQLELDGDVELGNKEFSTNYLESTADDVN